VLTFITHDQKNDNFFKKSGYYTIRLVLYLKQNKHHSGQEKKIRVAIHKLITRYMIHILIIDFQYFFKECHTYETTKQKKYSFIFKINHQEGENKKSLWWYME